jgi:hypothetical protein
MAYEFGTSGYDQELRQEELRRAAEYQAAMEAQNAQRSNLSIRGNQPAQSNFLQNILGTVPSYYEGLLGPTETQALQSRANTQGLLGAAIGLLGGMGTRGTTAAQNIAGALSGGLQASQGAVQQGIQSYSQQQQLMMQKRQQAGVQAMKLKYPELADELDTNPAGAFRIIADIEKEARTPRKRNTAIVNNVVVDTDTGLPIYQAPAAQEKPVVVGNALVNPATGQPIYQAPIAPRDRKTAVVGGVLVDTETGKPIYTAPKEAKAPESLYSKSPIADANGRMVFLPTRPGLPVLDLQGKPVSDFASVISTKPLPPVIQKAEEEDYTSATAAINLANDADKYLSSINQGQIKFGRLNRAGIATRNLFGSDDPDVVARNDFERFKTKLINETLRQNKGTQTDTDALRAVKEIQSAESASDAASAMQVLRNYQIRIANDQKNAISRRRKNAKLGEPEVSLDIPKFLPYVFTEADYARLPKGSDYIDPQGLRKVKP